MLNIELLDDPRISLLINCPREMKSYIHTDLYVNVHRSINIGRSIPKWKKPNVHEPVNGQTDCGLSMQWSTIPAINTIQY